MPWTQYLPESWELSPLWLAITLNTDISTAWVKCIKKNVTRTSSLNHWHIQIKCNTYKLFWGYTRDILDAIHPKIWGLSLLWFLVTLEPMMPLSKSKMPTDRWPPSHSLSMPHININITTSSRTKCVYTMPRSQYLTYSCELSPW